MPKFAIIDKDGVTVINTVLADSKESLESFTGLLCIEYTTEPAEPGGTWDGQKFITKSPGSEYVWNDLISEWVLQ